MSSSEIFAARFELEGAGKVQQMPGKNFVKSSWERAFRCQPSALSSGAVNPGGCRTSEVSRPRPKAHRLSLDAYQVPARGDLGSDSSDVESRRVHRGQDRRTEVPAWGWGL